MFCKLLLCSKDPVDVQLNTEHLSGLEIVPPTAQY